ncbi:MAG: HTH domain-containing protein [Candidatus Competibacter sp.]|nr:HTH domain-containing protein [Candidatus Competibacter sp.]
MAIYSYLDLAKDVLASADKPLTYQEVWEAGKAQGLTNKIKTSGKTPWQTLGAQLYVEVRDNDSSIFIRVGKRPARFFLKSRGHEVPSDAVAKIENEESKQKEKKTAFSERDLHPILTYFVYANPTFNRGRSIFTKTIYHEKSLKSGYNEWIHPDIVGFYLPLDDWRPDVIEFNRLSDNNSLRLFSFELKKSLNKSNYREAYFQAVSNFSWAHEGYLVAAEILQDDEFLAELERLASSFGIGIIQLDPQDIDSSSILYPARTRSLLDWETINKLSEQNKDFEKFLQDVKIDFESKRIHRAEFDEVLKDIQKYIREKLKIEQ